MRNAIRLVLSVVLFGCGDAATPLTPANDAGSNEAQSDAKTSLLGFTPSTVDLAKLDLTNLKDLDFPTSQTWETDLGGVMGGGAKYVLLDQPNGLKLGVFVARSFTVEPNAVIRVEGANALVLVALDRIDIRGTVEANTQTSPYFMGAGAYPVDASKSNVGGFGPGGGGSGTGETSGGGGSFCGIGGAGAAFTGTAATGGASYGTASLIPLFGGSSGGVSFATPGAGGGAIQMIAGSSITVSGTIHVGGEGAYKGGIYNPPNSQNARGGGSGGAIFLEAKAITVSGALAANGGGGGQGHQGALGANATADGKAAAGGNDGTHGSAGGDGSDGSGVDGKPGQVDPSTTAGGGGGGAGRIRINTLTGTAALTGTISPATTSACATVGIVAP
ncbi:hypothetical protein BH09MYX1_BH09MYX1_12320 [soil metagenome]